MSYDDYISGFAHVPECGELGPCEECSEDDGTVEIREYWDGPFSTRKSRPLCKTCFMDITKEDEDE